MLELTTKRPTMKLSIDGSEAEVPLTFTTAELVKMNQAEDKSGIMFDFFASYIPGFEKLGDDAVSAVMTEWMALRKEIGEPELGE